MLGVGEKKKAIPCIGSPGQIRNSIFPLLHQQWEAKMGAIPKEQFEEFSGIIVSITYSDFAGLYQFTTEAEIRYFPLRHTINGRAKGHGWTEWPNDSPGFEWRSITHRPFKKVKRPL
jgi:hypothetical protein